MDKKYELVKDDYINYKEKTLYRIKALRDFGFVLEGDVGGYIEKEDNLSHEGRCWIYNNAKVFGDARVFNNAKVFGDAEVYGSSKVLSNAKVYDNAEVYDNAKIFGNTEVYGNVTICGYARVFNNAKVFGNAEVYGSSKVYGNININKGHIVGKVSMPYNDIFQHQCQNRMLTAILTEDNKILYSIGCQDNITEEEFIYRIHNEDGGLEENPHRAEYLRLIKTINFHFKEKLNN